MTSNKLTPNMRAKCVRALSNHDALIYVVKELLGLPEYDGTPATSRKRRAVKVKARRLLRKAEGLDD